MSLWIESSSVAGQEITSRTLVEEGRPWGWEGNSRFGIKMLIRETENHIPLTCFDTDFTVDLGKPTLLCRGFPSVNWTNNSSLLQLEVADLNLLLFVKCSDVSNGGPVSSAESRAGGSEVALHDTRCRAAASPATLNPHCGSSI